MKLDEDLILLTPKRFNDHRGFFAETYNMRRYREEGITCDFVQDNHSFSVDASTIRGLHFQAPPRAQAKLVRCGRGAIFDVAVDIRQGSPTFGQWKGYELSADNGQQLYIPVGFAHGFITLQPDSEIIYKCSDYYAPSMEGTILWSDPKIGISWPMIGDPVLSPKDEAAPLLEDIISPFIYEKLQ
jgi:dTDP-4-dehydrorhamnose 3,5-epimerase